MNGLSNSLGSGASLVLTGPEGDVNEYGLHFKFPATNNEIEYEALITGFKIVKEVGVQYLTIFNDSQLVVGQVKGEYEAREENMKYLGKVKNFISKSS